MIRADQVVDELIIDDETAEQLKSIVMSDDHPLTLVEAVKLDPDEFRAFLEEVGEAESPEGRELISAAIWWQDVGEWVMAVLRAYEPSTLWLSASQRAMSGGETIHESADTLRPSDAFVRDVAYLTWDAMPGSYLQQQQQYSIDLMWTMEDYVKTVTNAAMIMGHVPESFRSNVAILLGAFSPGDFVLTMKNLVAEMSGISAEKMRADYLEYWAGAQKYIIAVMKGAINASENAPQISNELSKVLHDFSPSAAIESVRELAHLLWEQTGRPYGDAWRHWFDAESIVLEQITNEGISALGKLAPVDRPSGN